MKKKTKKKPKRKTLADLRRERREKHEGRQIEVWQNAVTAFDRYVDHLESQRIFNEKQAEFYQKQAEAQGYPVPGAGPRQVD